MNDARFSMLVERYLDREGSADEMAELQLLLRENAGARERFWKAVEWQALFRQWGEQEWGRMAAQAERNRLPMPTVRRPVARKARAATGRRKVVRFPFVRWAAGIAGAAALAMLGFVMRPVPSVATVAKVVDAVWSGGNVEQGARLKPGRHRLEQGAVVIAFDRGARVVIEGPADFEVRGDNSSALFAGRVRAQVPLSAQGFQVETPRFTAVDLGTEFGCDLAADGTGEVHVFNGKVDLHTGETRNAPVALAENEAARVDHGLASPLAAQPFAFLSESEISRRERWGHGEFSGQWIEASRQINDHPATVLHFDFENPTGRVVTNRALRAPIDSDVSIFGCKPAEGRWPGKSALAFQGPDDRLEFALPGRFESLTLLAWVRVDSLHGGPNPLVMGRDPGAGEVNWLIHRDGGLGIEVRKTRPEDGGTDFLHSRPVIGPQNFGKWIFAACVLDGATGSATHYFNGERVGARFGFASVPFQLNSALVGNRAGRDSRKPGDPPPHLEGGIDQLAILSSALSPDDITRLYRQGKPGTP